jgi:hypothetical protein
MPCIPATLFKVKEGISDAPDFFKAPLLKCAHSGIEAIASGKRSAILGIDGELYRLKGCGNLEQGFVVEPVAYPDQACEIRGAQFETTAFRELYY